jgi:ribonuclease BN (tRNA processing enzyme)
MKIKVLGCYGGQLPGFNLAGFLIDGSVMLDAGTIGLKLSINEQRKVRNVFISHAHADHIGALPMFAVNITSNKAASVEISAAAVTLKAIKDHILNWVIWPDFSKINNAGGKPVFKYREIPKTGWLKAGAYSVKTVPVNHTIPAFGLIIRKSGKYAVYTGDTKQTDELWKEAARLGKNLKSVIIEAAYPNNMREMAERSGHLVPHTVELELKKLGALKPKIFIVHMKPEYAVQIEEEIGKIRGYDITMMDEGKTYNL